MSDQIYSEFSGWVENALSARLPDGIAAFHFNLYETPHAHEIELIGAPTYLPENSDWACDDIFSSAAPRFRLLHADVGQKWEAGLKFAMELIRRYIESVQAGASRLRESQAVSAGYVDGELNLIWRAA